MSDINRHRRSDSKRVHRYPVAEATVIEGGDQCWYDYSADEVKPASDFTWAGNEADTQANFRRDFVGIAVTASDDGDLEDVSVASRGVFEMDISSATASPGDRLGPAQNSTPDGLLDQEVDPVGKNEYGGTMRVVRRYGANTTRVIAEILPEAVAEPSRVMTLNIGSIDPSVAADVLTDFAVQFPFKLIAVNAVIEAALDADTVVTFEKDDNDLDDTLTLAAADSIGAVTRQVFDDANDRDWFAAGDNLEARSDGSTTTGRVNLELEIAPFRQGVNA